MALLGMLLMRLAAAAAAVAGPAAATAPLRCDVLVAGGSTAALSAALSAAVAGGPSLHVCLTEPTDELGGQLAYNPAIDYGFAPHTPSAEWESMTRAVTSHPSACRVSSSCFRPSVLDSWVASRLKALSNLRVLLRTTVRGALRDPASGRVLGLELVTRTFTAKPAAAEWAARLSDSLADWYSPADSVAFSKHAMTLHAAVVIEASELGDVLFTARLPHTQGVELPTESSLTTDDGLTQSACFTFFMELLGSAPVRPNPAPAGAAGPEPFWQTLCCCSGSAAIPGTSHCSWEGIWSYRRTTLGSGKPSSIKVCSCPATSQIDWDLPYFLP